MKPIIDTAQVDHLGHRPSGKPNINILLKKQSNKFTLKDHSAIPIEQRLSQPSPKRLLPAIDGN